jgi:ribosome-associated protein
MDIRKLQTIVVDALEDLKGQQISAFNTTGLTGLFDRVIIVTGTSNRHTRSLAHALRDKVKSAGGTIISVEGEETGEWVLVDLGDAVVHVMLPAIRLYYNLEELWGAKPVSTARAAEGGSARKTPSKRRDVARKSAKESAKESGKQSKKVSTTESARKSTRKRAEPAPTKRAPAKRSAAQSGPASKPARKGVSKVAGKAGTSRGRK